MCCVDLLRLSPNMRFDSQRFPLLHVFNLFSSAKYNCREGLMFGVASGKIVFVTPDKKCNFFLDNQVREMNNGKNNSFLSKDFEDVSELHSADGMHRFLSLFALMSGFVYSVNRDGLLFAGYSGIDVVFPNFGNLLELLENNDNPLVMHHVVGEYLRDGMPYNLSDISYQSHCPIQQVKKTALNTLFCANLPATTSSTKFFQLLTKCTSSMDSYRVFSVYNLTDSERSASPFVYQQFFAFNQIKLRFFLIHNGNKSREENELVSAFKQVLSIDGSFNIDGWEKEMLNTIDHVFRLFHGEVVKTAVVKNEILDVVAEYLTCGIAADYVRNAEMTNIRRLGGLFYDNGFSTADIEWTGPCMSKDMFKFIEVYYYVMIASCVFCASKVVANNGMKVSAPCIEKHLYVTFLCPMYTSILEAFLQRVSHYYNYESMFDADEFFQSKKIDEISGDSIYKRSIFRYKRYLFIMIKVWCALGCTWICCANDGESKMCYLKAVPTPDHEHWTCEFHPFKDGLNWKKLYEDEDPRIEFVHMNTKFVELGLNKCTASSLGKLCVYSGSSPWVDQLMIKDVNVFIEIHSGIGNLQKLRETIETVQLQTEKIEQNGRPRSLVAGMSIISCPVIQALFAFIERTGGSKENKHIFMALSVHSNWGIGDVRHCIDQRLYIVFVYVYLVRSIVNAYRPFRKCASNECIFELQKSFVLFLDPNNVTSLMDKTADIKNLGVQVMKMVISFSENQTPNLSLKAFVGEIHDFVDKRLGILHRMLQVRAHRTLDSWLGKPYFKKNNTRHIWGIFKDTYHALGLEGSPFGSTSDRGSDMWSKYGERAIEAEKICNHAVYEGYNNPMLVYKDVKSSSSYTLVSWPLKTMILDPSSPMAHFRMNKKADGISGKYPPLCFPTGHMAVMLSIIESLAQVSRPEDKYREMIFLNQLGVMLACSSETRTSGKILQGSADVMEMCYPDRFPGNMVELRMVMLSTSVSPVTLSNHMFGNDGYGYSPVLSFFGRLALLESFRQMIAMKDLDSIRDVIDEGVFAVSDQSQDMIKEFLKDTFVFDAIFKKPHSKILKVNQEMKSVYFVGSKTAIKEHIFLSTYLKMKLDCADFYEDEDDELYTVPLNTWITKRLNHFVSNNFHLYGSPHIASIAPYAKNNQKVGTNVGYQHQLDEMLFTRECIQNFSIFRTHRDPQIALESGEWGRATRDLFVDGSYLADDFYTVVLQDIVDDGKLESDILEAIPDQFDIDLISKMPPEFYREFLEVALNRVELEIQKRVEKEDQKRVDQKRVEGEEEEKEEEEEEEYEEEEQDRQSDMDIENPILTKLWTESFCNEEVELA